MWQDLSVFLGGGSQHLDSDCLEARPLGQWLFKVWKYIHLFCGIVSARWSGSHNNWNFKQLCKLSLGDAGELGQEEGDCQDGTHSPHCLRVAPESASCAGDLTPAPRARAPGQARSLLHREPGGWGGVSLLSAQSPGWLPSKNWLFDLSQSCRIHECKHPTSCPPEPGNQRASPRRQLQTWGAGCKSQGWGHVESSPPGDAGSLEHSGRKA